MPQYELPVIGMCRFSFVGRGDWKAYRDRDLDHTALDFRSQKAAELYDETRMRQRFFTLERFLLKSMDAQQDNNFFLIILTSDLMPERFQQRLLEITKHRNYAIPVFSSASDVNAGMLPEINRLRDRYSSNLVQFRIDDDDCLSADYVLKLRQAAARFQDLECFSFSIPKGLVMTAYSDTAPSYYELYQPFLGVGCALLPHRLDRTVFSFGHFGLMRRWPAFLDNGPTGYLLLHLDGHDSRRIEPGGKPPPGHTELEPEAFEKLMAQNFGFVSQDDLDALRRNAFPEI